MAPGVKRVLVSVLRKLLGDYVLGLDAEHLDVSVWSGKVELRDLALDTSALDALGLPLRVLSGGIARLDSNVSMDSTDPYALPSASPWFPTAPAERPPLVHTHSAEVGAAELIGLLHSDDAQAQAVN